MPVFPFPPVEWNDIAPRTQSRTQGCAHIGTGAALIRPEPPCRNFHDGKVDAPHRGLGGIDQCHGANVVHGVRGVVHLERVARHEADGDDEAVRAAGTAFAKLL